MRTAMNGSAHRRYATRHFFHGALDDRVFIEASVRNLRNTVLLGATRGAGLYCFAEPAVNGYYRTAISISCVGIRAFICVWSES